MREYEFEVTIVAVVRVRAGNEDRARELLPPLLSLKKSGGLTRRSLDKGATIVAVDVSHTPRRTQRTKRL
jgi:hypothetical protein